MDDVLASLTHENRKVHMLRYQFYIAHASAYVRFSLLGVSLITMRIMLLLVGMLYPPHPTIFLVPQ